MKNKSQENYSIRELDVKFTFLETLIREKHDDTMFAVGEVRIQTTKTNGYVADLIKWKWILVGFSACVSIILLPLLFSLIQAGKL